MQALFAAPVDMTSASPPPAAAASTPTGQDGLFAARLKTASENRAATEKKSDPPPQQSTDAATTSSSIDARQPETAEAPDQADQSQDLDDQTVLAASLNGAATVPPAAVRENAANADGKATDEISVAAPAPAPAPARSNESAVALMLGALTAGTTAAPAQPDAAPTGKTQASQETVAQANTAPQNAETAATPARDLTATAAAPALSDDATVSVTTLVAPPTPLPPIDDHPLTQQFAATADLIAAQNSGQTTPAAIDPMTAQGAEQSAAATTAATAAAARTDGLPTDSATDATQDGPQLVQNQYGQILAIHQAGADEEATPASAGVGKTAASGADGKSMDINSNYIHSRLPDGTSNNTADQGDGQQTDNAGQNQQAELSKNAETGGAETQPPPEQLAPSKGQSTANTENQGLVFAHQRNASPPAPAVSTTESTLFRLPSGTTVPDGTVVDQMIGHFSMNRGLESGSVNLRLHPQELGELLMEIKVEQDNVKAHITTQNPQAQEMIDRHLPRLREALEQQGLHLQQVEVTVAANDNAGGERFQDNNAWRQPDQSAGGKINQPAFTLDLDESGEEPLNAANTLSVLA
jgi:flagellar hook-length control protein FliK